MNISEKLNIIKKNPDFSNCDNQNKKDSDNKNIYNNANSYLNMSWDSTSLVFSVREPFPSKSSKANLVFGVIKNNQSLTIISKMPENGVIFSDGVESDFLTFSSGMEAKISISKRKGHLVV